MICFRTITVLEDDEVCILMKRVQGYIEDTKASNANLNDNLIYDGLNVAKSVGMFNTCMNSIKTSIIIWSAGRFLICYLKNYKCMRSWLH